MRDTAVSVIWRWYDKLNNGAKSGVWWLLVSTCSLLGWLVALAFIWSGCFFATLPAIIVDAVETDWANSCGGNANNVKFITLNKQEHTIELKRKIKNWLRESGINNVWCSKWSFMSCKYVLWLLVARGDLPFKELVEMDRLFIIQVAGSGLAAICNGRGEE